MLHSAQHDSSRRFFALSSMCLRLSVKMLTSAITWTSDSTRQNIGLLRTRRIMDYSQYEAEIYAKLQPFGDPTRTAFVKNYMKSELEFLAIKVPVLRQVAREGFSFYDRSPEEALAVWNAIWFSSACFEVMCMPLFYY